MRAAVVVFPGSNCDRDLAVALEKAGADVTMVWHKDTDLPKGLDFVGVPGGFSFGDYLRCGAIAARSPIMDEVMEHVWRGGFVLGICNGAQVLVESGLVPGLENNRVGVALTDNKRIKQSHVVGVGYYNTWAYLKVSVTPGRCAFTRNLKPEESINIPLAHGEGRFVIPDELLEKMISNKQTVYRYCDKEGNVVLK